MKVVAINVVVGHDNYQCTCRLLMLSKLSDFSLYIGVNKLLLPCFIDNKTVQKKLSFKLLGWVFCLFRFNRNNETLCFGIEAKQPKQTVKNRKNRKKPKKSGKAQNSLQKIAKYAPYQTVSVGLLFCFIQSKHRNSLFWYRSETTERNVLFRKVPKLNSVPVSVVSNQNQFQRTP